MTMRKVIMAAVVVSCVGIVAMQGIAGDLSFNLTLLRPEPLKLTFNKPEPLKLTFNKPEPLKLWTFKKPEPLKLTFNKPEPLKLTVTRTPTTTNTPPARTTSPILERPMGKIGDWSGIGGVRFCDLGLSFVFPATCAYAPERRSLGALATLPLDSVTLFKRPVQSLLQLGLQGAGAIWAAVEDRSP